jgi:hypothetical protein
VGRAEPDGAYTLTVTDQGIGMSAEQLAEANHQLGHPPLVGLALSRSLGFIVIGRLAQRFHIEVELVSSPSGGIAAQVHIPATIVTDEHGEPLAVAVLEAEEYEEPEAAEEVEEPEAAEEYEEYEEYEVDENDLEYAGYAEGDAIEDVVYVEEEAAEEYAPEYAEEEEVEEEPAASAEEMLDFGEPASLEEAMPEGDAFDRGLESLISGETAPGPTEAPVLEAEPQLEPEPVLEAEPVAARAEAEAFVTAAEPQIDHRPPPTPPPPTADITAAGLVKRTPKKQSAAAVGTGPLRTANTTQRPTSSVHRSPEEVRKMLSRYRGGLQRGRGGPEDDGAEQS